MELRDKKYIQDIQERVQKGYFHDFYGPVRGINFLIDSPQNNQIYYYISMQASRILQIRSDININIYLLNFIKPCFWPMFAIYPIREFSNLADNGIATSVKTLQYLANTNSRNKYYYVYDITELRNVNVEKLKKVLNGFKIFTRNNEYDEVIKQLLPDNQLLKPVPDFNIINIMENING